MAIVSNLRVQQEKAAVAQHIKRVQQQADAALAKKKALEEKRQRDEDAGKKTQKMAQDKVNKTVAQQREVWLQQYSDILYLRIDQRKKKKTGTIVSESR
jgi:hypothetical protein